MLNFKISSINMILPHSHFLIKGKAIIAFTPFFYFSGPKSQKSSLNNHSSRATHVLNLLILSSKWTQNSPTSHQLTTTLLVKATIISQLNCYKHPTDWFACTHPCPITQSFLYQLPCHVGTVKVKVKPMQSATHSSPSHVLFLTVKE